MVPLSRWADGAWHDRETGRVLLPLEQRETYLVVVTVSSGASVLIAYPTQQWQFEGWQAGDRVHVVLSRRAR